MEFNDFINNLKNKYTTFQSNNELEIIVNSYKIIINLNEQKFNIINGVKHDHTRIFDLSKQENWCVLFLLLKLFKKGYSNDVIYLEKCWQLGHADSGYLDVMLTDPNSKNIYMIEVKTQKEIESYTNTNNLKKMKQLLSYAMQEKHTKLISYYTYDFINNKDMFYNIFLNDLLEQAVNVDDLFDRWEKIFNNEDFILNNSIFNIHQSLLTYSSLSEINKESTNSLYNQFITILRLNSVSDKPNAFNKVINLFLAKIVDESQGDTEFIIKDKNGLEHKVKGVKFQYVQNIDSPESFMKRLNELYKKGMEQYLNKYIIDYSDKEILDLLKDNSVYGNPIWEMINNLRLKKNNDFAFIEVYDDNTFKENFIIVRDLVKLLQSKKFKYDYKQQFLGDFFENLLNTSLKQEAGQFFTPQPLVDFIVKCLPFDKIMEEKIANKDRSIIPNTIDYACGAGHFLVSAMEQIQSIINEIKIDELSSYKQREINDYKKNPFNWVNKTNIVGIDKDYRLAKTTKIATFLNGDGEAEIISGDGINKFSCSEYQNTVLSSDKNKIEYFDILISNPPYSVNGFMYNLQKNNIIPSDNTFSLFKKYNFSDTMIETLFTERAWQLLKEDGVASIILPQSVLTMSKYTNLRNFLFQNFKIDAMLFTSDITFLGTTTSPVIFFLKKQKMKNLDYRTMLVFSDKYQNIKTKKRDEEAFLGYKFSSDRNKSGTELINHSKLLQIQPILKSFLNNNSENEITASLKNNIVFINLNNILINEQDNQKQIFPKYKTIQGKSLNELGCTINPDSTITGNFEYIEISGLKNNKIYPSNKTKDGRICNKNDILISSLVTTSDKIAIADKAYIVSKAIHIIRISDNELRNKIFEELKKDYIISQIHSLLEGFKLTYSKINDKKLFNYIKLKI